MGASFVFQLLILNSLHIAREDCSFSASRTSSTWGSHSRKILPENQNIKQNHQKEHYHQDNIFSLISGNIMVINKSTVVIYCMLQNLLREVQRLRHIPSFSLAALFLAGNPFKTSKGCMSNSEFQMIYS